MSDEDKPRVTILVDGKPIEVRSFDVTLPGEPETPAPVSIPKALTVSFKLSAMDRLRMIPWLASFRRYD